MMGDPPWRPAAQLPPARTPPVQSPQVQSPPVQAPRVYLPPMHLAPVYPPPVQSLPACPPQTRPPASIHPPPAHPPPPYEPRAQLAADAAPVGRRWSWLPGTDQGSRIASPIPCNAPETMYIEIERVPMWMSPLGVMPGIRRKPSATLRRSALVSAMRAL